MGLNCQDPQAYCQDLLFESVNIDESLSRSRREQIKTPTLNNNSFFSSLYPEQFEKLLAILKRLPDLDGLSIGMGSSVEQNQR